MRVSTTAAVYPLGFVLALGTVNAAVGQTTNAPSVNALPGQLSTTSPSPASDASVSEVVVTGSRIGRRDFVSESPIVTIGQAALQATGSPNLEDTLNQLPQLATSAGASAGFNTRGGQASADLRGLGQQRTLVLIDGHRLQPSSADGSVDLNTIPPELLSGTEIITGGASAVYGSDAVTGVVNLKLRHDVNGMEVSARYGASDTGDGATQDIAALIGGKFADNKAYGFLGFDYSHREGVFYTARDYLANQNFSTFLPEGRLSANAANLPSQAAVNAVFAKYGAAAGSVPRTTLFGFNTDGTLFSPAGPTNFRGTSDANVGVYQGTEYYEASNAFYLQSPQERYNLLGRLEYQADNGLKLYLQGLFTDTTVKQSLVPAVTGNTTFSAVTVPVTSPFISSDLATILVSRPNPTAAFNIGQRLVQSGVHIEQYHYDVYQFEGGVSGKLPFRNWTWNANASYGRTDLNQTEINYSSISALNRLIQAPDGGRSLCLGGYNPFGTAPISAQCNAYIARNPIQNTSLEQQIVELNLAGSLFKLPAGDLRVATGADYRREGFSFNPDTGLSSGDIIGILPVAASNGTVDVEEGYFEGLIPVVKNLPLVKEFNVDVAYRYSSYNLVGATNTYKADIDWLVIDGVRLRGGYSRAVRAPSVGELFAPSQTTTAAIGSSTVAGTGDPCDIRSSLRGASNPNAAAVSALCVAQGVPNSIINSYVNSLVTLPAVTAGNLALRPEIANTYSVGAVFRPDFRMPVFSRISLSVDYYNIGLKRAIGTITTVLATQRCFNADGSNPTYALNNFYCSLISRDPTSGSISLVKNPLLNLGGYTSDGIDVEGDWNIHSSDVGLSDRWGRLALTTDVNYLRSFKIASTPQATPVDYAGTIGDREIDYFADAHPQWKATSSGTWSVGPVDASLRWRYIGVMKNSANLAGGTFPNVHPVSYFDLSAAWHISHRLQVVAGIDNLADKAPPLVFTSLIGQNYTDPYTYDLVGRRFFVQLRAKF